MKPMQPQPPEWIDRAPVRIVQAREIGASADRVFDIVTDHERWPEWFTVLKQVEVTAGATGVGGGRRVTMPGLVVEEEFIEWEDGRRFGFTLTAGNRPMFKSMNERIEIEPLDDDRCRVTYRQGFDPKPWAKLLVGFVRGRMQKGLADGLDGLAARAEGGV